jgi:hypothetical protein
MNPNTGKIVSLSSPATSTPFADKPAKPNITLNKATLPGYVAQPMATSTNVTQVPAKPNAVTHSIVNVIFFVVIFSGK